MALGASRELRNAGRDVYRPDLIWLMFMAVGAGVFIISPHVTALAVVFTYLAMVQGEDVDTKMGRLPGDGGVAADAVQAKLASMNGRLAMAFGTVDRGAVLNGCLVTGLALQASVPAL
jgi:hypothetical protein